MATEKDYDSPTATHPAVDRMADAWLTCRDTASGTRAVKANPRRYLPRHESEADADWKARVAGAELYNGFRRTVAAMTGLATQRPVAPTKESPASFGEVDWKNIDGAGADGATFARKLFADAMITGLAGILVDAPEVADPSQLSAADEQERQLRPYWIQIGAEDVISWRTVKVDGKLVLVQLVVRERVEAPVGAFGVTIVTRYRVFRRAVSTTVDETGATVPRVADGVEWELWQEGERGKVERLRSGELRGPVEIPFSPFVAGNDPAFMESEPPLLDLADVNLAHYRVSADRRWLMHIGCVPVPVRVGYRPQIEGQTMPFGPNILQDIPQGGDFFWAEIAGGAFAPTKDELDALERRMGSLGLAFLASETRGAETAEAKRIDSQAQNATLASVVTAFKACLDRAGVYHAQYQRLDTPPTFDVNTDFERQLMETGLAQLFSDMEAKGQLSLDTLFVLLKRGNLLPHDFDGETEQERVVAKGRALLAEMDGEDDPPTPPGSGDRAHSE